jgi:hypothetical protein
MSNPSWWSPHKPVWWDALNPRCQQLMDGVAAVVQRGDVIHYNKKKRSDTWAQWFSDSSVDIGLGGASTVSSGGTVCYGAGVATSSGTEITRSTVMPFACTLRGFILITTSTQSAGGGSTSLVATVRVALASPSSGLVINVAAGASAGPYSDSTDTATVAAGQAIDIQITNNGSGTSAGIGGWSIGCVPN